MIAVDTRSQLKQSLHNPSPQSVRNAEHCSADSISVQPLSSATSKQQHGPDCSASLVQCTPLLSPVLVTAVSVSLANTCLHLLVLTRCQLLCQCGCKLRQHELSRRCCSPTAPTQQCLAAGCITQEEAQQVYSHIRRAVTACLQAKVQTQCRLPASTIKLHHSVKCLHATSFDTG
jgi:hypothetical protein